MTVWRERPTARLELRGDRWWHENPNDPEWIMLGFAPVPRSVWQAFWYHFHHGRLMRYPLPSVLAFSWRHRHSWTDERVSSESEPRSHLH